MTFSQFSSYIQKIEETASRLTMTEILADLFSHLDVHECAHAAYLLQGNISPKYRPQQFNFAEKLVIRSLAELFSIQPAQLTQQYKQEGDLGTTIQGLKQKQKSINKSKHTIEVVFAKLVAIAQYEGAGSQERKMHGFAQLISEVDPLSARYLVRIPVGALRLGFSDMTMLDALSWMMTGDKSLRRKLQKAYHVFPDLGYIGTVLKKQGLSAVEKIKPEVFTPIIMMRAERITSAQDIIDKIGTCIIEPKYDGFRLQVHKKGDKVVLFTRGLEVATYMYPDIVKAVQDEVSADEIIFEGEAIGYNPETSSFLPFQLTVQRKRKHGISEKAKEIPLKLYSFDLLYLDGTNHIHSP